MIKNRLVLFAFLFFLLATTASCVHMSKTKNTPCKNVTGMYHGLLPCASCSGIDSWLQVSESKDGLRFKMIERYLEEKDGVVTSTGSVKMLKSNTLLQLQGEKHSTYFLIKADALLLLGKNPQHEENDAYRLYKMPSFD